VLRANEPGDWNDIDPADRDVIEQFKIKSNVIWRAREKADKGITNGGNNDEMSDQNRNRPT